MFISVYTLLTKLDVITPYIMLDASLGIIANKLLSVSFPSNYSFINI